MAIQSIFDDGVLRPSELTAEEQNMINSMLNLFDFERIHNVMHFLEWSWTDIGVPTIEQLRRQAYDMMEEVVLNEHAYLSTGGFIVRNVDGMLDLSFNLSHVNSSDFEE